MLLTNQYGITKEKLFAELQSDGVHVDEDLLNRAKRGDSEAFYDIGVLYISKEDNQDKIMTWFQLSADRNNSDAQYHIGLMYHYGQNTSIDYLLAMEWYLKAAKQAHLRACMEIGYLYQHGYGVPANEHMAFQWFCKSKRISRGASCMKIKNETEIGKLIRQSEQIVWLEKEKKRAMGDSKTLVFKPQENDELRILKQSIASLQQKLQQKESRINALEIEKRNMNDILHQEIQKKDNIITQLKYEKNQALTQLNQTRYDANERIQCLSLRNTSLEEKITAKNKEVLQLHSENCTIQNLLNLSQYQQQQQHQHYQQQQQQQQQKQHQQQQQQQQQKQHQHPQQHISHENDVETLAGPEQCIASLSKQEKQNLLDEMISLKILNTQRQEETKVTKEKILMPGENKQSLCESNDQTKRSTECLEKSNQTCISLLEEEKQNIFHEIELLKQSNTSLEQESKKMKEKIRMLESTNQHHNDRSLIHEAKAIKVAQKSENLEKKKDNNTALQNEIKQKDKRISILETSESLYEQTLLVAEEMTKTMLEQKNAEILALEEENQQLMDEIHSKALYEKEVKSKNKTIEKLESEIKRLKYINASLEYEASD